MKTIQPAELATLLASRPATTVLDVRTPAEVSAVQISGARNLPLGNLVSDPLVQEGGLSRTESVYLLCRSGGRAENAAQQLARAGFAEPVVVEGGIMAWEKAGLPVVRGASSVISLERQVRIGAGALVVTGIVLSHFVHPYFIGISAFVGAGLVFAGVTDWCGMGLLLARFPWNTRSSS